MSDDDKPRWIVNPDGFDRIELPARPVATEWRIRFRMAAMVFREHIVRVAPNRTCTAPIVLPRSGTQWCAQERPAPERRSGKDRRKPIRAVIAPPHYTANSTGDWAASTGTFTGEAR